MTPLQEDTIDEVTSDEPVINKEPAPIEETIEEETTTEITSIEEKVEKEKIKEVTSEEPVIVKKSTPVEETVEEPKEEKEKNQVEIISISPMFFEAVHRHAMQANLIENIDETADEYSEKGIDNNTLDLQIQKNKLE